MFGTQLRKYRKKNYLTQKELAYRVEVLTGKTCKMEYISAYENGTNPKIETIVALAEILNIPEQYLFDDSKVTIKKIIGKELPSFHSLTENTIKIPLVDGYVGAGSGGLFDEVKIIDHIYTDRFSISKCYRESNRLRALIVVGDSMKPYVDNADIVVFNEFKADGNKLNDGKYIITTENGTMLKNLTFKTNGDVIISSLNPIYESETINGSGSQEHFSIEGIVAGRILKS
jgi:transcriptional regulator with XRE-family HTH domain